MSRMTPFAFGLALPMTLISNAALADLTPAQVWGDWRSYMESFGYTVTSSEITEGGDLTVTDMNLTFAIPEGAGDMKMSVGAIAFRQNSDGTVAIVLPDSLPITMSSQAGFPAQDFNMTMNINQTGHAMTASGTPEQMTYLYTAETMQMVLDQVAVDAQDLPADLAKMVFTGTNLSNTTVMTIGETRGYEQNSTIENMTYDVAINTGAEAEAGTMKGTMSGIAINGTGIIPTTMPDMSDMAAMLDAGFDVTGTIKYQSGSADFDVQDPQNGNFKMQSTSQGGELGVAIGADGLAYSGGQTNLSMAVTAAGMPFPVQIDMAESGFNLAMPVKKSEDPQDFAFGVTLGDFTMSDLIWGMIDPTGQLPRDPATIKLDLSGKAKVLVDYLNPEAAAELTGAPGEMQALTLNNLMLDAVGAKLQGSGDFTFDGAGGTLVPGMGAMGSPVGAISLALAGGNGLIDKLIAMGMLPQEQAMGARMMMGLFTVPGDAPDTVNSKIEFTQDGQILANGQRIR